jgi:antitoxin (DNA-binding transcriptional repressor) of toxin-antitoxin stability system
VAPVAGLVPVRRRRRRRIFLFRIELEEEEQEGFIWNLKRARRFLMRWDRDQHAVALRQH